MNKKTLAVILGAIAGLFLATVTHANTLTWTDNSTDEDGFHIFRSDTPGAPWTLIADVGPNVVTFVDATGGKDACYVVTAFRNAAPGYPEVNSFPSNFDCMPRVKPNSVTGTAVKP